MQHPNEPMVPSSSVSVSFGCWPNIMVFRMEAYLANPETQRDAVYNIALVSACCIAINRFSSFQQNSTEYTVQ